MNSLIYFSLCSNKFYKHEINKIMNTSVISLYLTPEFISKGSTFFAPYCILN